MKTRATYYIRYSTYWQNAPDWFAGPFASREEAQKEIERATDTGKVDVYGRGLSRDVKNNYAILGIVTKTEAKSFRADFEEFTNIKKQIPVK